MYRVARWVENSSISLYNVQTLHQMGQHKCGDKYYPNKSPVSGEFYTEYHYTANSTHYVIYCVRLAEILFRSIPLSIFLLYIASVLILYYCYCFSSSRGDLQINQGYSFFSNVTSVHICSRGLPHICDVRLTDRFGVNNVNVLRVTTVFKFLLASKNSRKPKASSYPIIIKRLRGARAVLPFILLLFSVFSFTKTVMDLFFIRDQVPGCSPMAYRYHKKPFHQQTQLKRMHLRGNFSLNTENLFLCNLSVKFILNATFSSYLGIFQSQKNDLKI